jgi:hypothetical protein
MNKLEQDMQFPRNRRRDIETRLDVKPVRELITVTNVDTFTSASLGRGRDLFLIRGYVFSKPVEQRTMRTPNGFMATLCRAAIGHPPLQLTWKRSPCGSEASAGKSQSGTQSQYAEAERPDATACFNRCKLTGSAMLKNWCRSSPKRPRRLSGCAWKSISGSRLCLEAVMMKWLRKRWCGWRGHDVELQFKGRTMKLHCLSCGHDSPGWTV